LWLTSQTVYRGSRGKNALKTRRTASAITWRFVMAKFAAARMAPMYRCPSSDDTGTPQSWRSGTSMP